MMRFNDNGKKKILETFCTEANGKLAAVIAALSELCVDISVDVELPGSVVNVAGVHCAYGSAGRDRRYAIGEVPICWDCPLAPHEILDRASARDLAILLVATTAGRLPAVPKSIWSRIIGEDWNEDLFQKVLDTFVSSLPESHTLAIGLCEGRHPMPVTNYLFPQIVENPCDIKALYETADRAIPEGISNLRIYVSGLTQALTATIRVCQDRCINLILMHYDREQNRYYPELMLQYDVCPFCGGATESRNGAMFCSWCGAN